MHSSVAMMKNWFIIKISEQPNNGQNKPLAHDATATATVSGQLCCCFCCSCSCSFRTHPLQSRQPPTVSRHPPPADCNSTTSTTFFLCCLCKSVKQWAATGDVGSDVYYSYLLATFTYLKLNYTFFFFFYNRLKILEQFVNSFPYDNFGVNFLKPRF